MKRALILFAGLLACYQGNAQFSFKDDSSFAFTYNDFENQTKSELNNIDYKKTKFELRIWQGGYGLNKNLILIKKGKRKKWEAYKYYFRIIPAELNAMMKMVNKLKLISTVELEPKIKWRPFWKKLIKNDILTLPDESLLRNKMLLYLNRDNPNYIVGGYGTMLPISSHSAYYTFELISKKAKRKYTYKKRNSKDEFRINIPEIDKANKSIEFIFETFNISI